jgi:hypothetical protein
MIKHKERKSSMKELNIEEIKEVNREVYKNMVEIYGDKISDEMWGSKICDALWELGYSVYKGEISIKDAKERLMKYRSYICMRRMLCMMKGKRFNEKKEVLDIDVFDIPVTKKQEDCGNVSIL